MLNIVISLISNSTFDLSYIAILCRKLFVRTVEAKNTLFPGTVKDIAHSDHIFISCSK